MNAPPLPGGLLDNAQPCTRHQNRPHDHCYGAHIFTMRWFKVVSIDANEDSQAVEEFLRAATARGITEADAAPITS